MLACRQLPTKRIFSVTECCSARGRPFRRPWIASRAISYMTTYSVEQLIGPNPALVAGPITAGRSPDSPQDLSGDAGLVQRRLESSQGPAHRNEAFTAGFRSSRDAATRLLRRCDRHTAITVRPPYGPQTAIQMKRRDGFLAGNLACCRSSERPLDGASTSSVHSGHQRSRHFLVAHPSVNGRAGRHAMPRACKRRTPSLRSQVFDRESFRPFGANMPDSGRHLIDGLHYLHVAIIRCWKHQSGVPVADGVPPTVVDLRCGIHEHLGDHSAALATRDIANDTTLRFPTHGRDISHSERIRRFIWCDCRVSFRLLRQSFHQVALPGQIVPTSWAPGIWARRSGERTVYTEGN